MLMLLSAKKSLRPIIVLESYRKGRTQPLLKRVGEGLFPTSDKHFEEANQQLKGAVRLDFTRQKLHSSQKLTGRKIHW